MKKLLMLIIIIVMSSITFGCSESENDITIDDVLKTKSVSDSIAVDSTNSSIHIVIDEWGDPINSEYEF